MKKRICALTFFACLATTAHAQFQVVSIQDIQTVSALNLAACVDTPQFLGDTLITRGTVVMDGGLAQIEKGRNVWLQSGAGPFSGIELITTGVPVPLPGIDVLDLLAGDSVAVTGIVSTFGSETVVLPINIDLIDIGRPVSLQSVNLSDLNDGTATNILPTGEQWEGVYVEINNATVVSVNSFSETGVDRVNFDVRDAAGNIITVSDRFLAQRLPAAGGSFTAPAIGTAYDALRGVVAHSGNGCTGGSGNGYELFVFDASGFVVGSGGQAPQVGNSQRSPITPTSSEDFVVTTQVTDADGSVVSASIYYAVGVANSSFAEVAMADMGGGSFQATIPASGYSDGDLVKYYVCATDNDALTACNPNVPGGVNPLFFRVRDDGLTIADVQFTPYSNGNSGYQGLQVTLSGIVTASGQPDNLGAVYIQEPGENAWAGIALSGNSGLAALEIGDRVEVTGVVQENFGFTEMANVSAVSILDAGNSTPDAVVVDPGLFSIYDFGVSEKYEGMLVRLQNAGGGSIFVVDANPDDPNNFGEYRVGTDVSNAAEGIRVVAGRQTSSITSSLSFSFINDETWITNSGTIDTTKVAVCVVTNGDSMPGLTGIMWFGFGTMKLLPRNNADALDFSGANCPGALGVAKETLALRDFAAYPNPTTGALNFDYSFTNPVRASAVLFDVVGREVASTELPGAGGTASIDTRSLSAGTYFVLIVADDQPMGYRKVIVLK